MRTSRTKLLFFVVALVTSACNELGPELATPSSIETSDAPLVADIQPGSEAWPDTRRDTRKKRIERTSIRLWRKGIPIPQAIARLEPHVDVPVVVPDLPRKWRAVAKETEWHCRRGFCSGHLELRYRDQILLVDLGRAGFDACGGDSAIPTRVLGQPALISTARGGIVWSHIIWPARPGDDGRYGLAGTFEQFQILSLAESMEAARLEILRSEDRGC